MHLAGLISRNSGTDTVALTLPADMRPGYDLEFSAVCDIPGLSFDPRPGVVFIDSDGDVRAIDVSGSFSCTERLSLDGITFRAGG